MRKVRRQKRETPQSGVSVHILSSANQLRMPRRRRTNVIPSNATPNNASAVELGSGTVPDPLGPPVLLETTLASMPPVLPLGLTTSAAKN